MARADRRAASQGPDAARAEDQRSRWQPGAELEPAAEDDKTRSGKYGRGTAKAITRKPLDWSRTNPDGETAEEHVRLHAMNDTSKPLHGVFNGDPISTTNDAWARVQANGVQPLSRGARDVYTVPMDRVVGWEGGSAGSGSPLTNVVIVVERNTTQVVTAFPK